MDFVEICNVCARKVIIKAAKKIFNSDKICRSYCDFYFGVTFLEHIAYKIWRGIGQSSELLMDVLVFRYVAPFQNQSASK